MNETNTFSFPAVAASEQPRDTEVYFRVPELGDGVYSDMSGRRYRLAAALTKKEGKVQKTGQFYLRPVLAQAQPTGPAAGEKLPDVTPEDLLSFAHRMSKSRPATAVELAEMVRAMPPVEVESPMPVPSYRAIDVSTWTEFGDFFKTPETPRVIYKVEVSAGSVKAEMHTPVSFLVTTATKEEDAVAILRQQLALIAKSEKVVISHFLAKPQLRRTTHPSDMPEYPITAAALPEPRAWTAFCFLGVALVDSKGVRPVCTPEELAAELGVAIGRYEGASCECDSDLGLLMPPGVEDGDGESTWESYQHLMASDK
jgi:hypothetical protein